MTQRDNKIGIIHIKINNIPLCYQKVYTNEYLKTQKEQYYRYFDAFCKNFIFNNLASCEVRTRGDKTSGLGCEHLFKISKLFIVYSIQLPFKVIPKIILPSM